MADTSWEYVIPGVGTYNDTSQDFEPVIPGSGTVNEGATEAPGGFQPAWAYNSNIIMQPGISA